MHSICTHKHTSTGRGVDEEEKINFCSFRSHHKCSKLGILLCNSQPPSRLTLFSHAHCCCCCSSAHFLVHSIFLSKHSQLIKKCKSFWRGEIIIKVYGSNIIKHKTDFEKGFCSRSHIHKFFSSFQYSRSLSLSLSLS
jgi:hypothetical protein